MKQELEIEASLIDRLFAEHMLRHPDLTCPNGHKITQVCIGKSCQKPHALVCASDSCEQCYNGHFYGSFKCTFVNLHNFTDMLEQQQDVHRQFMIGIRLQEKELMKGIEDSRLKVFETLNTQIGADNRQIVESLYIDKKKEGFTAEVAARLLETQEQNTAIKKIISKKLVKKYKDEIAQKIQQIQRLRSHLIQCFIDCEIPDAKQPDFWRESEIIRQIQNPKAREALEFLGENLTEMKVKGLKLLYRGSESNFSAKQFHGRCDHTPHTLVLVRNELGKTFGGYTPVSWQSTPNQTWVSDNSGRSFLFSLDLRQRYNLNERSKSICNHRERGPCFGGGYDLFLGDNCKENAERAKSSFPSSYMNSDKKEGKEETWSAVFGTRPRPWYYSWGRGRKEVCFKVEEYEVFEVQFW